MSSQTLPSYPAGLIPVVTIDDYRLVPELVHVLADSGATAIEITLRTSSGFDALEAAVAERVLSVGVGTVTSIGDMQRSAKAGADFAVSPGFRADIVAEAQRLRILPIPGVATATEVMSAVASGLTLLKFFPAASSGGTAALRSLAEVFPETLFMPTGGIGAEDVRDYLSITSVAAVGASWLAPREMITEQRFSEIGATYSRALASIVDLVS